LRPTRPRRALLARPRPRGAAAKVKLTNVFQPALATAVQEDAGAPVNFVEEARLVGDGFGGWRVAYDYRRPRHVWHSEAGLTRSRLASAVRTGCPGPGVRSSSSSSRDGPESDGSVNRTPSVSVSKSSCARGDLGGGPGGGRTPPRLAHAICSSWPGCGLHTRRCRTLCVTGRAHHAAAEPPLGASRGPRARLLAPASRTTRAVPRTLSAAALTERSPTSVGEASAVAY
jgi:hypothetical protein